MLTEADVLTAVSLILVSSSLPPSPSLLPSFLTYLFIQGLAM
jgi:hypothetical protein